MNRILRGLGPAMPRPGAGDILRAAMGAGLALLSTGLLLGQLPGGPAPALIAPFGASVFLIFAVPSSPLAQPWSVVAGSVVSALVAVAAGPVVPRAPPAAPVAPPGLGGVGGLPSPAPFPPPVCGAILPRPFSRPIHPPAGAVALLTSMTADPAALPGPLYVLSPVADGAVLLVICGLLWNRLTGRVYPFRQPAAQGPHGTSDPVAERRLGLRAEDLQTILTRLRLSPNLGPEDLGRALEAAEAEATARHLGGLTASDVMSRDVIAMPPEATEHEIALAFRRHGFNTLPVRDTAGRFAGIIQDRDLIEADPSLTATDLARPAIALPPTAGLADLLPLLSDGHQQSVPIVEGGLLTGIVTRSDLITLLAAKIRSQDMA